MEVQFKAEYTLVGRGCSKKLKSCCNYKNRSVYKKLLPNTNIKVQEII
jgi:hypothetical protein